MIEATILFKPVEDKPGYYWFNKRNYQIISEEIMKEYTFNSPSVKKMLETVEKYMTISKWKENYEIVIEKDKECKMNNKINCKDCQYKHMCKNYTEEIKYEN